MPYFLSVFFSIGCLFTSMAQSTDSISVLFIGNSITYFNDMPQLFRSIANSKGKAVSVDMYAPGGTGFVNHVTDPNVYERFRNEWDVVVLQPGSGESAGASWPVDTTIRRGRVLLDSIYAYSPCAKVFLYEIPYGVPSANDYPTYFSVQDKIQDSISKLSDSMQVPFLPAGECARAYYSMHQNLLLHGSFNDIHPNVNGSYLVAASFYCGIFRETVSGTSFYAGINQDTVAKFCSIADTVVLNHQDDWNIHDWQLNAGFSTVQSGNSFAFTDASDNATSVVWDFGDGQQSSEWNPQHVYGTNGSFIVIHYVFNGNCVDSSSLLVEVSDLGITATDHTTAYSLTTSPHGISVNWNFPGEITAVAVYTSNGSSLNESDVRPLTNFEVINPTSGLYVIRLITHDKTFTEKVLFE